MKLYSPSSPGEISKSLIIFSGAFVITLKLSCKIIRIPSSPYPSLPLFHYVSLLFSLLLPQQD